MPVALHQASARVVIEMLEGRKPPLERKASSWTARLTRRSPLLPGVYLADGEDMGRILRPCVPVRQCQTRRPGLHRAAAVGLARRPRQHPGLDSRHACQAEDTRACWRLAVGTGGGRQARSIRINVSWV